MDNDYLAVVDFDNTVADTFSPSPGGLGVVGAYERAIRVLFGEKGVDIFQKTGGLRNQAPGELVEHLLTNGVVPLESLPSKILADKIVEVKLSYLLQQIGPEWPKPCQGIKLFFETIEKIKKEEVNIQVAILSSGHEGFIRKTFKTWDVICPKLMLTDDDVRERKLFKPSLVLFDLIHARWRSDRQGRQRMIYFGDDILKDGELARRAGVPFGWFNRDDQLRNGYFTFRFQDWKIVAEFLARKNTIRAFLGGRPFFEIVHFI